MHKVITKLGTVYFHPTGLRHVYMTTDPDSQEETWLTVRGKEYRVSAHYHADAEGNWELGPAGLPNYQRNQYLYCYKRIAPDFSNRDAPEGAIKTIREELLRVLADWVNSNWPVMKAAGLEEIAQENAKLRNEIACKTKEIQDLRVQVDLNDTRFRHLHGQ